MSKAQPVPAVAFNNVWKSFDGGAPVLRDVTLEVSSTCLTFLVGRSGSGKSVFCKLAVGMLKPDQGSVWLRGHPISTLSEPQCIPLRKQAPYIVQGPALLDTLTLEQNVALALRPDDGTSPRELLARVGLENQAHERPGRLPLGIQKRVAIARALARKPSYLLLDEPTTGLDHKAAVQVVEVLRDLRRSGLGALIISHDYWAVSEIADEVVLLSKGEVAYSGPPGEFFARAAPEIRQSVEWERKQ